MRTILVTGASGFLGHHFVKELLKQDETKVVAILGRLEGKANVLPENTNLQTYSLDAFFHEMFERIDTVVNCAFARSNDARLLAAALDFTEKAIKRFEELDVKSVINISSQGVYKRLGVGDLSREDSPIEPIDLYSMAKYATEKLFLISSIPYVTNVRLASLLMPERFLYFFVNKAKAGEHFTLTAPNQYAALLDVTDASKGLAAIAGLPPEKRANIYNLGIGTQYSLLEYAERVKAIGDKMGYNVNYNVVDNGTNVCAGMDCTRIMRDCNWTPAISTEQMIKSTFEKV